MGGQGGHQRLGGHLRIPGDEAPQGVREMTGPGPRVADQHGQRPAVQGGVLGPGEQGQRRVAQQVAVGVRAHVPGGEAAVGDRGAPAGRPMVVGPAVDGAAERGGLLLREHREQFRGLGVGAVHQRLGEVVEPPVAVGVEQRLGGHGDRGVRGGGQRTVVVEPVGELPLGGGGVLGEQPCDRLEPAAAGARRSGDHQAVQQPEAFPGVQRHGGPEVGAELLRGGLPLPLAGGDPVGEQAQQRGVRGGVGEAEEGAGQQPGGPPGVGRGLRRGGQRGQAAAQFGGAAVAAEVQEGLDDGADAVARHRQGVAGLLPGAAAQDQGAQRLVDVEVEPLEPVGELLVGEPVAGAGGDQQAFGEDGTGPAGPAAEPGGGGTPGEDGLEGRPVELALAGAEAAAGRLVDLSGDRGGQPADGRPALSSGGGEAHRDAQAGEVEVGGEHLVPAEGAVLGVGQRGAHGGEQPEGERVAGVGSAEYAVGDAEPLAGQAGLLGGEVAEAYAGRQGAGAQCVGGGGVEQLGRELGAGPFPVLGAAADGHPGTGGQEPVGGAFGPGGQPVGEQRRHLLGPVQDDQQRAPGLPGDVRHPFGREVAEPGRVGPALTRLAGRGRGPRGETGGGGDPGGPVEGAACGVGNRGVAVVEVRAAQPEGGCRGVGGAVPAGGELGEGGGPAAAGRADQSEHGRRAPPEGGELALQGLSRYGFHRPPDRSVRGDRGGREFDERGQVEVGAVGGDGGGVAGEQVGERARGGSQRQCVPGRPVAAEQVRVVGGVPGTARRAGPQVGGDDSEHRAGDRVQHRSAGGPAAGPQRLAAGGADGEFQHVGQDVVAVDGVGHAEHPGLPQARGDDPDVGAGADGGARGDRQRCRLQPLGPHQGQAEGGQRDDGALRGGDGPSARLDEQARQAFHHLVGGDHGAVVVGGESGAAPASGGVAQGDEGGLGYGVSAVAPPPDVLRPRVRSRHAPSSPPPCRSGSDGRAHMISGRSSGKTRPLPLPPFTPSARPDG